MPVSVRTALRRLVLAARFFALYAAYTFLTAGLHGYLRAEALRSHGDVATTYSMGPLDRAVFGETPTVILQRALPSAGLEFVSFVIWASLFYLPLILAAYVLATRGVRPAAALLALHLLVVLTADAVYAAFPTRPPWMDEPVRRSIEELSGGLTSLDANPFASAPSLHVGVPAAYALWFMGHPHIRLRRIGHILAVWVALMTFVVIYTGEHYFFGALAGVVWAAACYLVCRALRIAYPQHRLARDAAASPPHAPTPLRGAAVAAASQMATGEEAAA
jgi:hypothetical protein